MTKHPDLFAALAAPFDPNEVKSRQQAGRQMHYITARTAMNRLDAVFGPENWEDDYVAGENSVLCKLTVELPCGKRITKCDAGGYAGMPDSGDDDKSGYSDAFKRAAVKFGVGRYLYRDGTPDFHGGEVPNGTHEPSQMPSQARQPYDSATRSNGNGSSHQEERPRNGGSSNGNGKVPRSGKGLFAWTKEQEQIHEVSLLKYLNQFAQNQGFPGRMVDFTEEQVAVCHAEAVRKLGASLPQESQPY